MSDPAKTPEEIEDVLASVRRLVSDHSPTPNRAAPPQETPAPEAPALAEALVLTPSFRVTDPEDPWVPVTAPEEDMGAEDNLAAEDLIAEIVTADGEAEEPSGQEDPDWQPEDRLAHFDAVGDADAAEADTAPEEWVDDDSDTPSDEDMADLIRLDGSEASVADFESETGDDNWPEGGAEAALLTLVARREPAVEEAEAADAALEDALLDALDAEDRDTAEAGVTDVAEVAEPVTIDAAHCETLEVAEAEDLGDEQTPEDVLELVASDDAPGEDAYVAEDDTDEGVGHDTSDEEAPDGGAVDETPAEGVVHVAPEFAREETEEADTPVEDLGDTPSPFTFPESEEGILDEDTLREIIVDVVREELQGVLGQRITRNVRKMVRREIRLALAAEDLE